MATRTIQTVSEAFVRKVDWLYERLRRQSGGGNGSRQTVETLPDGPDDLIVHVGSGGIRARSGATVYGEMCPVYRLTGDVTSGEMTLTAVTDGAGAARRVMVYNLINDDVEGPKYVVTTRLKSGVRYVSVESCETD